MVPEGWTYSTLEGLIDIKHGFAFKSEHFTNQGQFVLLTPGHFNESGGFRDQQEKTKYYNGVIPDGYLLTKGDLLLAMTEQAAGLLGSAAHIPEDNIYLHNQRLGLVKVLSPNKIDSRFLFWVYNSPEVRKQIAEQASGTKVKHTSPGKLIGVSALIPPIAEQTKIAQILSTWDKAIATTERLLANSQQQKQALMQQLLTGQKRLHGFSGSWLQVTLDEIFEKICNGTTYDANAKTGLPVSRIETISTGKINFSKVGWAPDNENTRRFKLKKGDILYSHINSLEHIGRVALFNIERPLFHGMNLLLLRPNTKVTPEFIFHMLNSEIGKKYARNYAKSAVNQASISTTDIKSFVVNIPALEEQQKIAQVLSTADAEIANLQSQLAALKLEKKALMQQLLTGQRRVKLDAEVEAPIRRVG